MSSKESPIILYDGPEGARRWSLAEEPVTVGRGTAAEIRINDRGLSTRHCRIEPAARGGWKLVDLGSRNGTYINDVLVKQRMIEDGDQIRLGRVVLRFYESADESDLHARVARLVANVTKSQGKDGLRKAAKQFANLAVHEGVTGLLVDSQELRAAEQIQRVMNAMLEERNPSAVFEMIVDSLIEFTGAERGFFILAEGKGNRDQERRVVAARNFDREGVKDALAKISRTIERKVLADGDPIIVTDAILDDRFAGTESIADMRLRSILCIPVRGRARHVGTIYLDNRFEEGVFKDGQLPLMRMFADQAAIALWNAELHAESSLRLEELTQAKSEVDELNRVLEERVAQTSAELMEVKEHLLRDRDEAPLKYSYSNIIAKSRRMRELFHLLDKVTDSDVPVLIQGESGTGKELVSRAIHFNGPRKSRPFISENCAAIPETLLESELFGYKKGAFTGATADKKGLFEAATGGTLFLDEIGDMPMTMQKKLLRVLQEREVRPVGGKRVIKIDVRILAASNQDLRKLCEEGRFREDLYFRLNVITVELPPLRERRDDIPLLVHRFLDEIAEETQSAPKSLAEDALKALMNHHWPGNVRELRNEIQRAAALTDNVIVPMVLTASVRGHAEDNASVAELGQKPLREMVREVTEDLERKVIQEALRRSRGRKAQAARLLGVSRPTLDSKIEHYGLVVKRE